MYEWAELRHFRYLLTILERQGFRAAAEELRTAQPNLSVQARQFQESASVRLFRKMKGGRIRPTDTGVAFKVLARFLLETRDEVLDALIAIERGEVSSVRFGCTPLVDQGLFRAFCELHKELLPVCPVRPTHGDTTHLAEEVASGTVDAAFVTLPLRHPELRIEELRRDRLVVCLGETIRSLRKPLFAPLICKAILPSCITRNDIWMLTSGCWSCSQAPVCILRTLLRLASLRDADSGQRGARLRVDSGGYKPR
jgi:DNA-binding transcriptional LysR family regulator